MHDRERLSSNAVIKVLGVGGGGGNAINTMIECGLSGVEFIAANTDVQALQSNLAPIKVQLGRELTKGLGAGANPDIGRDAALEDRAIIQEVLNGADMVFITAGMGGGTGTGAAPIIAQIARELGALTVGVVTKPFVFEGKRRKSHGEHGIQALRQSVDTLITIPNQRLLSIAPQNMSMLDGFKLADEVLLNAVKGISDIINIPGRVNVDFADVRTIMSEMGMALMGIGTATGQNRALEAARLAINSPLLEDVDIEGATGILINITGSSLMTLHEISEASSLIQEAAHEDANIIFGAVIDETLKDNIRVTVIATGFDRAEIAYPDPARRLTIPVGGSPHPAPLTHQQQAAVAHTPYQTPVQVPATQRPAPSSYPLPGAPRAAAGPDSYYGRSAASAAPAAQRPQQAAPVPQQPPIATRPANEVGQPYPQQPQRAAPAAPLPVPAREGQRNFNDLTQLTFDMASGQQRPERPISGGEAHPLPQQQSQAKAEEHLDEVPVSENELEAALSLAEELSDVSIEGDFETPAYLRQQHAQAKDDENKSKESSLRPY